MTEALVLLKLRWQIELLNKLWKSHGQVDETRGQRPARVLAEVYAKFIGMLIQHWLLLTGCWQTPDRSLPKAAKLVRDAARDLARAMRSARHLRTTLRALIQRLERAGRQTKRQKEPNAYQLLQNPELLSLT
ncbi:MAG: transposase [Oscillochloris sp.]|nr:transposase [Oscillochloris sp.]